MQLRSSVIRNEPREESHNNASFQQNLFTGNLYTSVKMKFVM